MTAVLSMAHPARHPHTSHSHSYGSYSPHSSDGRSMSNSFISSPVPSLASSGPGKLSLPGIASLISDVDRDREPYRQTASPLPDSYRPSLSQAQRHPPLPSITSAPSSYYGHNEHARDSHRDYIKPPVSYLGRPLGAPPTPDISPALSSRSEFPSHARARLFNDGRGYATHPQSLPPYQMSPIPSPREDRLLPREPTLSGSLVHPPPSLPSLHAQRPLPQNFPPASPSVQTSPPTPESQNSHTVWQHHHYISPASQAGFPQTQDRYVCGSCSKAFSRPSSLKIHSHSHTGEKPFNCPHAGCRKSFSVRSNMKRHERGCHVGLAGDSSRAQSVESSES